ncbi:MAG TPA: hypothetical protein VNB22_04775 [Pyrinomonadaceae bacterium]|nr:hypothetical protein [Pyrinomonadaceae bacterium]
MKNYKVTLNITRAGETEIMEAEFGGRTPDESITNLMELAFELGRDAEVEHFSVMSVDEIEEFTAAAPV